jgi:hypothetical protein
MTIKELIDHLKVYPGTHEVRFAHGGDVLELVTVYTVYDDEVVWLDLLQEDE